MLKLYKKTPSCTFYHEAWRDGKYVKERRGTVGSIGKIKRHRFDSALSDEQNLLKFLQPAIDAGMLPIPVENMETLVVVFPSTGNIELDIEKKREMEDFINELLGQRGFGHCDGSSVGGESYEISCLVVDFVAAKQSLEYRLSISGHGNFSRIYCS